MRLRLYTRRIEFINGKEKLYRDIAVEEKIASVENAKEVASKIVNNLTSYWKEYGKAQHEKNFLGINFKIKDLDTKEVVETFEIRF